MAHLFRGVSEALDADLDGVLMPRGSHSQVAILSDGAFLADGTMSAGGTFENAARAHRIESGMYGGSVVSFTRDIAVAIRFATSGGGEPGYIYVVEEGLLAGHGILCWDGYDAEWADEKEVSLSSPDGGPLPMAIVVEKFAVDASGKRSPAE